MSAAPGAGEGTPGAFDLAGMAAGLAAGAGAAGGAGGE